LGGYDADSKDQKAENPNSSSSTNPSGLSEKRHKKHQLKRNYFAQNPIRLGSN